MLKWLKRENFSEKNKTQIIKNASRCQICLIHTNCGECAHIVASGKNGPRNKQELTRDGTISDDYNIQSVDNGIYLCANCHTMIDRYPERYTFEYLKNLTEYEDMARNVNKKTYVSCQCIDCGKQFGSKQALYYHTNHKVCQDKFVCQQCHVVLSSKHILDYHVSHNVCAKKMKAKLSLKNEPKHLETVTHPELYEKNLQLKEYPVVAPAFLKYDKYVKIMADFPHLLHGAMVGHCYEFISYLIKATNCNPKFPMYNSVKITDKNDLFAQISDGEKYIVVTKKRVIADLIENKKNMLQEYLVDNGDRYEGTFFYPRYEEYMKSLEKNEKFQKDLEEDIICMLLDNSNFIGSDEWSKRLLENFKKEEIALHSS